MATGHDAGVDNDNNGDVIFNGTKYNLSPGWGARPVLVLPGDTPGMI